MGNSKTKYFLVTSLIIIAILFYLFDQQKVETPYQVLTPPSYEEGTTVFLYKDTPPGFPDGIILEDNTLDSSTIVAGSGRDMIKVSYTSDLSGPDVLTLYTRTLPEKGWKISAGSASYDVASFFALKEEEEVSITVSAIREPSTGKEIGARVTFQYNK